MKLNTCLATILFCACGLAFAADKHQHSADDHKPRHGGVVVGTSAMDFELVAKPDVLTLHLRDHGKPASAKGASGKITILNGADKAEAALASTGDDRLEARGTFKTGPGTKFVATVTLPGKKPMNVRFALK